MYVVFDRGLGKTLYSTVVTLPFTSVINHETRDDLDRAFLRQARCAKFLRRILTQGGGNAEFPSETRVLESCRLSVVTCSF